MPFSEAVYETLMGELIEEYQVPGIENMFQCGSKCELLYQDMRQAYNRLLDRLGIEDDDKDVEQIICDLNDIQKLVSLRMYEIGTLIGAGYTPPPF
jgi:hypothetical protein